MPSLHKSVSTFFTSCVSSPARESVCMPDYYRHERVEMYDPGLYMHAAAVHSFDEYSSPSKQHSPSHESLEFASTFLLPDAGFILSDDYSDSDEDESEDETIQAPSTYSAPSKAHSTTSSSSSSRSTSTSSSSKTCISSSSQTLNTTKQGGKFMRVRLFTVPSCAGSKIHPGVGSDKNVRIPKASRTISMPAFSLSPAFAVKRASPSLTLPSATSTFL
ncbi:hypothetical protein CYLTODRAFT_488095 [Cylindrobasidium torrendii FP15055 ss-10]|uniref:Uncharacterized protein n=1 Tax=Cylindrobasidium torrendii FP15055 ss-10 TaxID=1314674 RepID=A0A0D7BJX7_9AGAR|nr:hypothetical protein CYLTODRAFT_488095 [Cylindrobasidium torrendii FP15055 ss-10]